MIICDDPPLSIVVSTYFEGLQGCDGPRSGEVTGDVSGCETPTTIEYQPSVDGALSVTIEEADDVVAHVLSHCGSGYHMDHPKRRSAQQARHK